MKLVIYLKNKNLFNKLIFILFLLILILLLIFQKQNLYISKNVLSLWFNTLIPSLFPFLVFTEVLVNCNISYYFGKLFSIFTKLFNLPKESASAIAIGFICGYPNGAKQVNYLYNQDIIDINTAQKLLSFINNSNPIYIISSIGIAIYKDITTGIILYISHIFSSIIIGMCNSSHNIIPKNSENVKNNNIKFKENFIVTLTSSFLNAFKTLIYIFGFMIIFSLLSNIINDSLILFNIPPSLRAIICSLFEITSGVNKIYSCIDNYFLKVSITSFLISFSSISVIFQIYATSISIKNVSLKKIFTYKLIHGILSCIITIVIFWIFPFIKI